MEERGGSSGTRRVGERFKKEERGGTFDDPLSGGKNDRTRPNRLNPSGGTAPGRK